MGNWHNYSQNEFYLKKSKVVYSDLFLKGDFYPCYYSTPFFSSLSSLLVFFGGGRAESVHFQGVFWQQQTFTFMILTVQV